MGDKIYEMYTMPVQC